LNPNPAASTLLIWPQWDNTGGASKTIDFDANLSNYLLAVDTNEETLAGVAPDIAAAKTTYPAWGIVFTIFGM
jgi:hypothetical protein